MGRPDAESSGTKDAQGKRRRPRREPAPLGGARGL